MLGFHSDFGMEALQNGSPVTFGPFGQAHDPGFWNCLLQELWPSLRGMIEEDILKGEVQSVLQDGLIPVGMGCGWRMVKICDLCVERWDRKWKQNFLAEKHHFYMASFVGKMILDQALKTLIGDLCFSICR